jgi:hypothetical protein
MQCRTPHQHHRDRLIEVEHVGCLLQDIAGIAQVGVDVGGHAVRAAREQPGTSMREHDRVKRSYPTPVRSWRAGRRPPTAQ